jgi:hypothetical protein
MDPINYAGMTPAPDFAQSIGQGLQLGAGFQQLQQRRAELEKAQLAAQRTAQFRSEVGPALQAGDPAALVQLFGKYPDFGDQIKQASGFLNDADENNKKTTSATVYNGLQSGNVDIAKQALQSRVNYLTKIGADANEWKGALDALNSGDPDKMKQVQQQATLLHALYNPKAIETVNAMNTDRRAEQLQPGKVREGEASADEKGVDAATKSTALIGQTLGALQNAKNLKPSQVVTAIKSLAARGVIPKDQVDAFVSTVPTAPAELAAYLDVYKTAGMSPSEQMKYSAVDANTRANNAVTMRGQNMVDARAKEANAVKQAAANNPDGMIPPDVLTIMAEQALAGDTSVYQNLGRGAQGAKNIIALRTEVARLNKEAGGNGRDIAAQNAEYFGTKAGQRAAGTRIANVEIAVQEARNLVPLALDASAKVARSGLLPFGKAQIMFDTQTNDPLLGQFAAANNALINTYARAISPSGVPTVADKEHAREMLSTAKDHRAYVAIVKQMDKEMSAAQEAPQHVRQSFNQAVTGKKPVQTVPNPVQQGLPSGWSVKER